MVQWGHSTNCNVSVLVMTLAIPGGCVNSWRRSRMEWVT